MRFADDQLRTPLLVCACCVVGLLGVTRSFGQAVVPGCPASSPLRQFPLPAPAAPGSTYASFVNTAGNPFLVPVVVGGQIQLHLTPTNDRPVGVLGNLDINRDGVDDGVGDTDRDGLPDNWELGGVDVPDTKVGYYAPTAIGPGTPPVFLTARLVVFTSATSADTDGDGLTDFIEVFGLKYIDDNGNGKLDFIFDDANGNGRWDPGEAIDPISEWMDFNGDGLPSIGEYPLPNIDPARNRDHDFDGFVFTDPLLADTDGDGIPDGCDADPLINPQTFGIAVSQGFQRTGAPPDDADLDNDGLGNGTDFANDDTRQVDFPEDIGRLLDIFRKDRLEFGTLPESLIEDLLGADWDGNGFFRITDSKDFRRAQKGASGGTDCFEIQLSSGDLGAALFRDLFIVGPPGNEKKLYGIFPSAGDCSAPVQLGDGGNLGNPTGFGYPSGAFNFNQERPGMGVQFILLTSQDPRTLPDPRIWTLLYAWRQPGFDIDGDGFVGSPANNFSVDDRHVFVAAPPAQTQLDGIITVSTGICGSGSMVSLLATASLLLGWMSFSGLRRRRQA